eukprot:CAMPEP_0174236438 /NCGR_PEP_ID=MMETSP0417-20130205/5572_1 /TAXON_ID=242541 /ORGANISM="Mayorella sp, Strain BSH-02190019" /LENGTH=724 /DNA_ID=CAMNT_0015315079 /DNA_START=112 /DNA_END=2283 /DNA_ORIENTATION=-
MDLFGDDDAGSDSDTGMPVSVNTSYADQFEKRKRKEELTRLKMKERLGELGMNDDDDETSESEDEDAQLLTPAVHDRFLEIIPMIRKKDPRLYDKNVDFFDSTAVGAGDSKKSGATDDDSSAAKKKGSKKDKKPMYLKDVLREHILQKADKGSWSDSDSEDEDAPRRRPALSHVDEQRKLKADFQKAVAADLDGEGDDLFVPREKTQEEIEEENKLFEKLEQSYKHKQLTTPVKKDAMAAIAQFWNTDQNVSKQEKFLRTYILSEMWREDAVHRPLAESEEEEDAKVVDEADKFEAQYNFRHEEEGASQVKTYSRDVESVRKKTSSRTEARQRRKERKYEKKREKAEELKRLKNLKKQEISEKMQLIMKISGSEKLAGEIDLEGDFDPDEYEKKMQAIFNEEYYANEDDDDEKPVFSDDDDEDDFAVPVSVPAADPSKKTLAAKLKAKKDGTEQPIVEEFEESAESAESEEEKDSGKSSSKERKEKEKKRKEAQEKAAAAAKKIAEDQLSKYLEEYYQLDYEDIIDDIPCRFSYRQVRPNTFGMRPKDILSNDDHVLNQFVGLKRIAPYREREYEPREPFHHWVQRKAARGQLRGVKPNSNQSSAQHRSGSSRSTSSHYQDEGEPDQDSNAAASSSSTSTSNSSSSKTVSKRQKKHRDLNERSSIVSESVDDEAAAEERKSSTDKKKRGKRSKVKTKLGKKEKKAKRKANALASSSKKEKKAKR